MRSRFRAAAKIIAPFVVALSFLAGTTTTAHAGSQNSTQTEYIKRVDAAIAEVKASRVYIASLEKRIDSANAQIAELKKVRDLQTELNATLQEKITLLESNVADLKQALAYAREQVELQNKRVLEEMKRTEKAESSKRFWRKIALGAAAVSVIIVGIEVAQ